MKINFLNNYKAKRHSNYSINSNIRRNIFFSGKNNCDCIILSSKQTSINNDHYIKNISELFNKLKSLSFLGNVNELTKKLSAKAYQDHREIYAINKNHSKCKGFIGQIPDDWFMSSGNMCKEKLESSISMSFNKVAGILRPNFNLREEQLEHSKIPLTLKKADKILAKLFNGINLELLDAGSYGTVYSFSVNKKKYVLKVFHTTMFNHDCNHPEAVEGINHRNIDSLNGVYVESNRALYWQKHCPDSQYVDFYFANLESGYMVLEYLDENCKKPVLEVDERSMGFYCQDKKDHNQINGKYFEYGGQMVIAPLLTENKELRDVFSGFLSLSREDRIRFVLNDKYPAKLKDQFKISLIDLCFRNIDNKIQVNTFDEEEMMAYFKKFLQSDSQELELKIINKLEYLPEPEAKKLLNYLLP